MNRYLTSAFNYEEFQFKIIQQLAEKTKPRLLLYRSGIYVTKLHPHSPTWVTSLFKIRGHDETLAKQLKVSLRSSGLEGKLG
jgi:hypothetical protein